VRVWVTAMRARILRFSFEFLVENDYPLVLKQVRLAETPLIQPEIEPSSALVESKEYPLEEMIRGRRWKNLASPMLCLLRDPRS
jgi:hypothetical protein